MNRPHRLHGFTGEQLSRIMGDPDAVFARRDPVRDPIEDLRQRVKLGPQPSKLEWSFVCLVYAAICFAVVAF
jgi:hypothetical protein